MLSGPHESRARPMWAPDLQRPTKGFEHLGINIIPFLLSNIFSSPERSVSSSDRGQRVGRRGKGLGPEEDGL